MSLFEKLSALRQTSLDDLRNDFLGLEQKQQAAILVAIALILILLLSFPFGCVSSRIGEKEDEYLRHVKMASEFYGVYREYADLKNSFVEVKKTLSDLGSDPLKKLIYDLTDELGIEQRKVAPKTINPVTTEIFTEMGKEISISNLRLDQAVGLLNRLVHHEKVPVTVKKLSMKMDNTDKQLVKTLSFTMTMVQPIQ